MNKQVSGFYQIFICFLFLISTVSFADTVILQDDSVLNGEIVEKKKDSIVFKSVHGNFTIPMAKIKSIIEDKNELPQREPIQKPPKKKEYLIGMFGGYGLSSLEADVTERTGFKKPEPEFLGSYSIGASFNYFFYPFLSFQGSLSFDHRRFGILWEKDTALSDYEQIYTYNFLTFSVGARYYLMDLFYGGLGLYYGFIVGTPKLKSTGPGVNEEVSVESLSPSAKVSNSFGSYIELGIIYPIHRDFLLDFTLKVEGSFNSIFKSSDAPSSQSWNINPRSYFILIGIHYLL